MSGASGEPYFGRGVEMLPAESYSELAGDPASSAQRLNDKAFIDATSAVIRDLARAGQVVIIGRGANMILANEPGVIHVGLLGPLAARVETLMKREHITRAEAQVSAEQLEQARITFFRKFFKVQPNDPSLYHMILNLERVQFKTAAEIIVHATKDLEH